MKFFREPELKAKTRPDPELGLRSILYLKEIQKLLFVRLYSVTQTNTETQKINYNNKHESM